MKGRVLTLPTLLVFVVISIVVITVASQTLPEKMVKVQTGKRVVCTDLQHRGNRVLEDDVKTITVRKREAENYGVNTIEIICEKCQIRRAEEAQQAQIRQEAEEITKNLIVEFGMTPWGGPISNDVKLPPGSGIWFVFSITNTASTRLENVKLLIQPSEYLAKPISPNLIEEQREWTQVGKNVGNITPSNSAYYKSGPRVYAFNAGPPELREDIRPGQDIQFHGYMIVNERKIKVGTLTVHVMYPG